MAYSLDMRERAMEMVKEGYKKKEIARILGIGVTTLNSWRKKEAAGGLGTSYPKERVRKKVDEKKLKEYVEKRPDAYIDEIAKEIGSKRGTVYSAMQRLGITRKKRRRSIESETKRSAKHI